MRDTEAVEALLRDVGPSAAAQEMSNDVTPVVGAMPPGDSAGEDASAPDAAGPTRRQRPTGLPAGLEGTTKVGAEINADGAAVRVPGEAHNENVTGIAVPMSCGQKGDAQREVARLWQGCQAPLSGGLTTGPTDQTARHG